MLITVFFKKFVFVNTNSKREFLFSAEAEGFEPSKQLPACRFSKPVVSATHPHFLNEFRNFRLQR